MSCTYLYLKRNFHAIYLHLRGNSTSYIYLGSILVPSLARVHIFLKDSLCYLSTNIHTLKCIIYYSFTLQGIFGPYIHTLCNMCFMPYIFTHISAHPWKTSPMLLRCKVPIMGQPKFLQTSPYFHAFLILKPNFGFLAISMFPCIEATSLGS